MKHCFWNDRGPSFITFEIAALSLSISGSTTKVVYIIPRLAGSSDHTLFHQISFPRGYCERIKNKPKKSQVAAQREPEGRQQPVRVVPGITPVLRRGSPAPQLIWGEERHLGTYSPTKMCLPPEDAQSASG
ncbi:hypothetical protein Y1Q_0001611 [Alligator mississippiensis]|uniref:Uncharacterized protein n=1 Tax=Alligator mississippiensis TaxID=8496 RepID=A0A151MA40_ALLMI|nr:hypothetical protein Y1Q_0001611 [Alligator mississippiensis]